MSVWSGEEKCYAMLLHSRKEANITSSPRAGCNGRSDKLHGSAYSFLPDVTLIASCQDSFTGASHMAMINIKEMEKCNQPGAQKGARNIWRIALVSV